MLMYAVHSNNEVAFDILLKLNADLKWRNNTGANILQILAKKGLMGMAEKCWRILENKSAEERDKFINNQSYNGNLHPPLLISYLFLTHLFHNCLAGWTPLHAAIHNSHDVFTKWLLQRGADPSLAMGTGWTPSHEAALRKKENSYKSLTVLLEEGQKDASALKASHW